MDQSSCCPENIASDKRKAIEELVRGRETANKLQALLVNGSLRDHRSVSADHLVTQILSSFVTTLSLLNTSNSGGVASESDEVSFPVCRKSEDTGDSSKCRPPPLFKDRRGCYKRRKTAHSWTTDTPNLEDDGHAWRKYGQKVILHAKYPRSYFRCTHKYDQHCQATKQVQQLDEEPPMYRTTYYGYHTCNSPLKASQLLLDNTDSSKLLSFTNNNNNNNILTNDQNNDDDHHHPFFRSSLVPSVKQEYNSCNTPKENVPINDLIIHHQSSSCSDHNSYLLSSDHDTYDPAGADVISSSCTTSSRSLSFDPLDPMNIGGFDDEDVVLQLIHQYP